MSADQVNLSYAQAQQAWRAAQANREQRRIARDVSRAALEKALNGPPTSFDVDAARGAVAQAEAALAIRQHPYQDRDLEIARLGVRQAEEALAIRQHPYQDRDLEIARLAVKQADAQVRDLETLREQPIAATAQVDLARAQLEAARTTVIGAEAALAGAEARLDGARQGATATQIGV
ncbi:MAG: hypothetical protein EBT47_04515, partial [Chloroflexi bacterium]|nr:hypothetical protein [Chloroflexota bacterium]